MTASLDSLPQLPEVTVERITQAPRRRRRAKTKPRQQPRTYGGRYALQYLRSHPLASKSGYVFTHRKLLYDKLGPGTHPCHWCERPLRWGERGSAALHTDHLGDRLDDDPELIIASCQQCNNARACGRLRSRLMRLANWQRNRQRLDALGHLDYMRANERPPRPPKQRSGLTDTIVYDLRRRFVEGTPLKQLAAETGLSIVTVRNAVSGRTWSDLSGAVPLPSRRKLTADQVSEAAARYRAGWNYQQLADAYEVCTATMRTNLAGHVTSRSNHGSDNPHSRLNEAEVREIRRRYAAGGVKQWDLASDYNVGQTTISAVIRGLRWSHV
jgi:hypothetical protein